MDYIKTLNLPNIANIGFPKKVNPTELESKILRLWQELDVYEARQLANKGNPKFIIHVPPYQAYGNIAINSILSIILKDIIIKYKLMAGFDVTHIPIWNCYASGIEHEALKSLGNSKSGKDDGILSTKTLRDDESQQAKFRKRCNEICTKYVNIQKEQLQKLGIFASWDKALLTSDQSYESEIFRCFEKLHSSGYLNRSIKSKYWCINCQSDIDDEEIEYRGYDLLSLYVTFPVMHGLEELGEDVSLLVWLETPWALSTHKPVAVNPNNEYSAVEMKDRKVLVMASNVVDAVMQSCDESNYRLIKQMPGLELAEVICFHPLFDKSSKLIFDKRISSNRGTGCIYNLSSHIDQSDNNIEAVSLVNSNEILDGEYDDPDSIDVFDPINPISVELERRNYLLLSDLMEQLYPHCLYCKHPLIVRNNEHWIFDFEANHLKQNAIKSMDNMRSRSAITNRIRGQINDADDWNVSRRRIWGIPIPVFYCKKCDHQVDIMEGTKSCRAIIEKEGFAKLLSTDPNDILPYDLICNNCETRNFRWEMDILNEDFVSALTYKIISSNQKDLPENIDIQIKSDKENEKWNYQTLLSSVALENRALFNSIFTHGPVLCDEADEELAQKLMDEFGTDVFRLCAISTDPDKKTRLDRPHIESVINIYNRFRNVFCYLLANLEDFDPENDKVEYENLKEIDRWILRKLAKLNREVTNALEKCRYNRIYHLLCNFLFSDLSAIYINIARRKLYAFSKWSTGRRSIQTAIYEILTTLAVLVAPVLPFTADELWSYIPGAKEKTNSVFMSEWIAVKEDYLDDELEKKWDYLLKVRSAIYRALGKDPQEDEEIPNPMQATVTLFAHSYEVYSRLNDNADILEEVFMVSKARLTPFDEPIPDGILTLDGVDNISAEIRLTTGKKCKRCYIYSETVGTSELYPNLCHKCVSILEGGAEYV